MNEQAVERNDEIEFNLQRLVSAVWDRKWLVMAVAILCAAVSLVGTLLFVTPQYQSAAMFYVNNSSLSVGSASLSISSGDLATSRNLVNSYIVILRTRESLMDVIDYSGVNLTYGDLLSMIDAEAVNETEIFRVVVTSPDPYEAEKIANAIAYILPKRISSIIEGTSAKIVDAAVVPSGPSSPSYTMNTLFGFLIGFALSVGVIILQVIFDITIYSEEDIQQVCKHPVLASVPDMTASGKGGYEYSYDRKKEGKKPTAGSHGKAPVLIGSDISFAAAEAYKLLRTKLQFSFAEEDGCRVIGLSSALSGEGKSLSSVNLAYTLSQLNKRVILIDCDMRRPTLADKLKIQKKPGLSSFLTGQSTLKGLVQFCNIKGSEEAFHVITAGQNPPNPVELLSSARMESMLATLRQNYDYVILDLPPVGEVTDAVAVSKKTDGMLLVVRQNYCDRQALGETVRQFEFVDARILGIVYNCTMDGSGKGYYKKYYGRYGKKYYSRYAKRYYGRTNGYEDSYRAAASRAAKSDADKQK